MERSGLPANHSDPATEPPLGVHAALFIQSATSFDLSDAESCCLPMICRARQPGSRSSVFCDPHIAFAVAAVSTNYRSSGTALRVSFIEVADPYQSVTRSLKYVLLFLGLIFVSYFVFEVTTGKRVHPAQYVLVGIAQIIFYLLLLSLAERIGFDLSFMLAGGATVALLSANAGWVFSSRLQGIRAAAIFTLLYALIYLLLRLEDNALLVGALASFLAVAAAMYFTRGIDWYSSLSPGQGTPGSVVPR